jgi:hypothetical protein
MSIKIDDNEVKIEELSKEEFIARQLLQMWLLGNDPYLCLAYIQGLKGALIWSGFTNLYNDFEHLFDMLELHEQAGSLPRDLEGIIEIVNQYYGEKE